jgi:hypothetical protein
VRGAAPPAVLEVSHWHAAHGSNATISHALHPVDVESMYANGLRGALISSILWTNIIGVVVSTSDQVCFDVFMPPPPPTHTHTLFSLLLLLFSFLFLPIGHNCI